MERDHGSVYVALPHGGGYPILIDWGCLPRLGSLLRQHSIEGEAFLLSDKTVWGLYGETLERGLEASGYSILERFLLDPGEASKSLANWTAALDRLVALEDGTVRRVFLVNLGGGVIGDIGGFVAASYRRGIPCVQVPTSLLAQVDSSVGGKTAVNLKAGKNLAGSFYQPDVVIIDPTVLRTLPDHEYKSGLGEVVKYGLLHSESFFARLEEQADAILSREPLVISSLAKTCVGFKARVVEEDERYRGCRAVLNLGHTIGHALEVTEGYGVISHGRAVALGILVSLAVSEQVLGLDTSVRERTRALMSRFALPTGLPSADVASVLRAVSRDKKVVAGSTGFVGLRAIGDPVWGMDLSPSVLEECLEVIRA